MSHYYSPQLSSLLAEKAHNNGTSQNLVISYTFKDKIKIEVLESAIQDLLLDNEILNTIVEEVEGNFVPKTLNTIGTKVKFVEYQSKDEFIQRTNEYAKLSFFSIDNDLIEFTICTVESKTVLLMKIHHSICDAYSWKLILDQLCASMSAKKNRAVNQYQLFLDQTQDYFESPQFLTDKNYWGKIFTSLPEVELNTKHGASKLTSNRLSFEVPLLVSQKIRSFCLENKQSIYRLMMSALVVFKQRSQRNDDVVVGTVLHNRFNSKRKDIVGMMASTVPFRVNAKQELTVQDLLTLVSSTLNEVIEHQEYPIENILGDIRGKHGVNSNYPLFDIVLNYQNISFSKEVEEFKWFHQGEDIYPMIIQLNNHKGEQEETLSLDIDYQEELFSKWEVKNVYQSLITIVHEMITDLSQPLLSLRTASSEQIKYLKETINQTQKAYIPRLSVIDYFENEVRLSPDQLAISSNETNLTYLELNNLAEQLAVDLQQLGVEKGDMIGVCARKSYETIVGIIAILKLQAVYVPIDEKLPADRQAFIIKDCALDFIVGNNIQLNASFDGTEVSINLEQNETRQRQKKTQNINDPAYVMYTSGSTGTPKGVVIPQSGIIRLVIDNQFLKLDNQSKIIHTGAPAFDASTFEIWGALLNGGVLYIPHEEDLYNSIALSEYIEKQGINIMWLTSGLFNFLTDNNLRINQLKHLIVGGDVLSYKNISITYNRHPNLTIYNGYGPTENTTFSIVYKIPKNVQENIPLGKPLRNSQVYILDQNYEAVTHGLIGEICVGGEGLALKYLNNESLTKDKFFEHKEFGSLYKTGDFGQFLESDDVAFYGRIDKQIKVRGYRVELGEVEKAIIDCENIQDVLITVKGKEAHNREIWAFVTSEVTIDTDNVLSKVVSVLPEHALPSRVIKVDRFPLTPNGKIDTKCLIENAEKSISEASPLIKDVVFSDTEQIIAELWEEVLETSDFSKNSDFFACGGHSLKVMSLAALLIKRYKVQLFFHDLLTSSTIEKQALLFDQRLNSNYTSIPKVSSAIECEATPSQKRIFFLCQLQKDSITYNIPLILNVKGAFNLKKAYKTLSSLIYKYESLRTSFHVNSLGKLLMKVNEYVKPEVSFLKDVSNIGSCVESFVKPFDVTRDSLIRVSIIEKSIDEFVLMIDLHHLIVDGLSLDILKKEFSEKYLNSSFEVLNTGLEFRDYAVWEKQLINSVGFNKQKDYWLKNLENPPLIDFQTDYIRPAQQDYKGDELSIYLGEGLVRSLKRLAKEKNTSLHILMLAAYKVLLYFYTKQSDIIVGVPVNGRTHPEVKNMVGCFINLLPIRSTVSASDNFSEYLKRVKEGMINGLSHQEYPFDLLVNELNLERDTSRNPLIDTVFVLQENSLVDLPIEGLDITSYGYTYKVAKFDILTEAFPEGDDIRLNLNYSTSLFKKETINDFAYHFKNVLANICETPETKINGIEMLSDKEKQKFLVQFNDTKLSYPKEKTLPDLIEDQAKNTPDKIALRFEDDVLSYSELVRCANVFANYLCESGLKKGDVVGVMTKRSLHMMVAVLGVMKAGGTYLPIDPEYPSSRVQFVLDRAHVDKLIVNYEYENVPESIDVIDIRTIDFENGKELKETQGTSSSLAYLIFTSGSTGNPKGVMITHQAVHNFILGIQDRIDFRNKRTLALTTISFDIFVLETYLPLVMGGEVVIANEEQQQDSTLLNQLINKEKIECLQLTPSRLQLLMYDKLSTKSLSSIKTLMVGGEAFPQSLFEEVSKTKGLRIFNMYGPTETTVWSSVKELTNERVITLGTPISNTQIYVLDENLQLLPIGIKGDIYIAGDGLARGYWEAPDLTSKQFVDNPFTLGTKLYRTGDVGKWNTSGEVLFEGRSDHQVKIRGYRIELGEVENAFKQVDGVIDVVVIAVSNDSYKCLVGYYLAEEEISVALIKKRLQKQLPDYMVPEAFIYMDEFPLTPNGKLDKKLLPKPEQTASQEIYEAPSSKTEEQLTVIWKSILNRSSISIHDNFFDIGGNSLSLILMNTLINNEYPDRLQVADIFSNPTISKLAELIDGDDNCVSKQFEWIRLDDTVFDNVEKEGYKSFSLTLENEGTTQIADLASSLGLEKEDIFSVGLAYILYEVSKDEAVSIHQFNQTEEINQFRLDFSSIDEMYQLFEQYQEVKTQTSNKIPLTEIVDQYFQVPEKAIMAALLYSPSINYNVCTHLYDLMIVCHEEDENQTTVACYFNTDKLNELIIKSIFTDYIKVLDALTVS